MYTERHLYTRAWRLWLAALLLVLPVAVAQAQSSMTDKQVVDFIVKERQAGTSQKQIVTRLVQRGVDIAQIRRVKDRYQRQINGAGLGVVADEAVTSAESRMRRQNGEKRDREGELTGGILQSTDAAYPHNGTEQPYRDMAGELRSLPDSLYRAAQHGRGKRRVFGRDIFNNRRLTFEPNMNIATPQTYVLGPGDEVIVDVYGASQKQAVHTVSPDGDITIGGFGPVSVSGLTVAQANSRLRSTLGARYKSSRVRLTVGQTKTIMVSVMGEVAMPGTYTLSAFATVFHALYMAGGISEIGTLRAIKVFRQNKLVATADVYDYILNGRAQNIRLREGDVIVVGPYDCLVEVAGKVKRPMYYEMKSGESVGALLRYAGGFTGDAYTRAVRLTRKTGRERSVYNVSEFETGTFQVADGDSVGVDSILDRYENMVEVRGAVFRPGKYQVGGEITTVRSLMDRAEGPTEQAFTAHAVMHRMRADRTLEVIPVDLGGILRGTVADLPLQKNDVLFVPTRQDMVEERTLTIHGEVHYPGLYQWAEGATVEDLILQAGGMNDRASTVKVDVARRLRNPRATASDSLRSLTYSLTVKDGFVIDGQPGFRLQPYDEVYVRRSPGYSAPQNVYVEGQALFAGAYTLSTKNERLSNVIAKAGGLTDLAYAEGARLVRRATEGERQKMETIARMLRAQGADRDSLNAAMLQLSDTYPVGIDLAAAMARPGSDDDIVLREGDHIVIPEYLGTVKISGNVMYPNTVAYERGRRPAYYIDQAGGFGARAKKSRTIIVYMNGKVARVGHGAHVRPGCEIIVPSKPKRNPGVITQWLGIGTSIASLATMIATIANISK